MKNSITIAIFVVMVVVVVGLLVLPGNTERFDPESLKDQPRGSVAIIRYTPPVKYMPKLNVRPDTKRFPEGEPIQQLWMLTQRRSAEDALKLFTAEARDGVIALSRNNVPERRPYYATEEAQRRVAERAMQRVVLGMLAYKTMCGELVVIPVVSRDGTRFSFPCLVDRGNGWRFIMNHREQGGLDLELVVRALQRELPKRNFVRMPDRHFIAPLIHAAVKESKVHERRELAKVFNIQMNSKTAPETLTEEAEKCRVFLLKYPKSELTGKVRARLRQINDLLAARGRDRLQPYKNSTDFIRIQREKMHLTGSSEHK